MTNFNLNVPYNLQQVQQPVHPAFTQNLPQFTPNMQGVPPSMQGLDYDTIKLQAEAKAKDNAVSQAVRNYDVMEHPLVLAKNMFLSFLMSVGATAGTNWLMSSKKIADNATNLQDYKNTRLYKAANYLDESAVGKYLTKTGQKAGQFAGGLQKYVPTALKEVWQNMKMGCVAVWDKQGMYSIGKPAEAFNESIEFLSHVDEANIRKLFGDKADDVLKLLKEFKAGKVRGDVLYKQIAPQISQMNAKVLSGLNPADTSSKLMGVKSDINSAFHKAHFFAGNAKGPLGKILQKTTALFGEATGGGVLGGKMALLMNTVGLMTGFNAASNAEKGDKLKAFMEDYIGFTLGSYVMSFFVGTWFNKFLGVSELGMNKEAFKNVAKMMKMDASNGRVQDAVILYNKEYRKFRSYNNVVTKVGNGQMSLSKAIAKMRKHGVEIPESCKTLSDFKVVMEKNLVATDAAKFEEIRKGLKNTFKSQLTLKSVFKGGAGNEGSFFKRLGRYVVQKPLAVLGRALSVGRYDLRHGEKFATKSLLKSAKRIGGGVGRAILVGVVLVEPFRNAFMKLSHAIFGKPKNSALDEGKEQKQPQVQVQPTQQQPISDTNILNNMLNKQPQQPQQSQPVTPATPIASTPIAAKKLAETQVIAENSPELKRSYIPSPVPSKYATQKDPREAEVELAILKAEAAERSAQAFLSRGV